MLLVAACSVLLAAPTVDAQTPARGVLADGNVAARVPAHTAAPPAEGVSPMLHGHGQPIDGRQVHLRVWTKDKKTAEEAVKRAFREMLRISDKMSAQRHRSEIDAVNRNADKEEVILTTETYGLVQRALHICKMSSGAFDLTIESFNYLWNFKRRPSVRPLDDEVKARLALTGWRKVVLKPNRATRLQGPRMRISLAELLHGHAMNRVSKILGDKGINSFRLKIGRDVYVRGRTGTRHWYVAVHHPLKPDRDVVQLYLTSHAAATRSVSDRFFMKGGKRYHDVLSPKNGKPVQGVLQATVIGTDAVLADALSAAVFVLGPKAGVALLNRTTNVDGFIIDTKGKVHSSKGMVNFARLPKRIEL